MNGQQDIASGTVPPGILAMRDAYRLRREQSLLDAAAATAALYSLILADTIDYDAISPQMREAFGLAFPNDVLETRLADLNVDSSFELAGFMSNWRGKYFEVLVRDDLNSGGQVGDLFLGEGQTAVLAADISQPGWDLRIVDEGGGVADEIQLKATDSVSYIKSALERYPDVDIVATGEVAEHIADPLVMSSGISNSDLNSDVLEPLDDVIDSVLVDALEAFGAGLPVILIVGTEGTMLLMGRQDFASALSRSIDRAARTGVVMLVGGAAALAGAGMFSLPITFLTRLGMARHDVYNEVDETISRNTALVRSLVNTRVLVSAT